MRSSLNTSSWVSSRAGPASRRGQRGLAGSAWARPGIPSALAERDWLALVLGSGWALLLGMLLAGVPKLAVVLLAGGCVLALALTAPVTVLLVLLALTALVPYEVQHPLAIGATQNSPGLLPSDALLAAGLLRAVLVLPHMRLERRRATVVGAIVCFVAAIVLQAIRGVALGANVSVIGAEFRHLLGFATVLIAMPMLEDPRSRRRLLGGLLALGLALGLWGLAQWTLNVSFGTAGDVGVRQGVALTTTGSGQLQGGMFVYPVAVLLALAALVSGRIRSASMRAMVIAAFLLNCACLLLTFERTLWIATVVGAILVLARAGARARGRAFKWAPVTIMLLLAAMVLTPATFTTAEQRLVSIGQYANDRSIRYRVTESEHVLARIRAHPLTGSALGATIFWGRPDEGVPPTAYDYSHDGYLWLSWKLGIPAAALLIALLLIAIFWRGPPEAEPVFGAVRHGAQAALATLLITSATFPIVNSLQITCAVGLLLAIAAMPASTRTPAVVARNPGARAVRPNRAAQPPDGARG
jgi:O-Antigen ligase